MRTKKLEKHGNPLMLTEAGQKLLALKAYEVVEDFMYSYIGTKEREFNVVNYLLVHNRLLLTEGTSEGMFHGYRVWKLARRLEMMEPMFRDYKGSVTRLVTNIIITAISQGDGDRVNGEFRRYFGISELIDETAPKNVEYRDFLIELKKGTTAIVENNDRTTENSAVYEMYWLAGNMNLKVINGYRKELEK